MDKKNQLRFSDRILVLSCILPQSAGDRSDDIIWYPVFRPCCWRAVGLDDQSYYWSISTVWGRDRLVLVVCLAATVWLLAMLQTAPAGTHRQGDKAPIVGSVIWAGWLQLAGWGPPPALCLNVKWQCVIVIKSSGASCILGSSVSVALGHGYRPTFCNQSWAQTAHFL